MYFYRIKALQLDFKPCIIEHYVTVKFKCPQLNSYTFVKDNKYYHNGRTSVNVFTVQYSTVQYSTVQYSTVQYSTVQYSTVQYSTVQYSTVQYSTVQYSTVQYSTAQYLYMVSS